MEDLGPVKDSEAVSITEKETLHVDVDVHGFSDESIPEDQMKSNEVTGRKNGSSNSSTNTTEVSVVQKNLVTAEFAKMSNGILSNNDVMDSPTTSDQEVVDREDVVVLDEHLQHSNGMYKPGPKSKTRKSPPELLPIEQGAASVNGESATNRETPTRKAAQKSAEITKIMTQMKSRAYGEDMAVVEVSMGLRDSDATQVTIKKAADPSINHCLNCNKV
jgi:hypothetical protein